MLYTSGSTGEPKGVSVAQRGLSHYVSHASEEYLVGLSGAVVSSPLAFDATVTSLLSPLVKGLCVEVLPESTDVIESLALSISGDEAQLYKVTPAHLEGLCHVLAATDVAHCFVVGGEQFTRPLLRRCQALLPESTFINEYGPTETVVGCSIYRVGPGESLEGEGGVPIGKAIQNTQLYVVGAYDQLQPLMSIGELLIGGDGVANGYVGREDLTASRFVANPFSSSGRVYRTGDLVRYLSDGELEYIGRRDAQVKIRGYRIELGEIEQQLLSLPSVSAAVVTVQEEASGAKRLLGYVSLTEDSQQDGNALREALIAKLPAYMVPAVVTVLDSLPLTVNGKVNKAALPLPSGEGSAVAYEAPRNEVEAQLCAVWSQVLGAERVGRHDNFFTLGGDSILSIQVVSLLKKQNIQL
ncbi:non-ribosomal peptide synthetase, partial [Pseudoalteromonas sp. P1-9]|uniref:non-ribosomal peptide synthetase n=1 Tax=Pseudoalteromonas sp. P1-9 TaxID=1710354 RepID=UPI0022858B5E